MVDNTELMNDDALQNEWEVIITDFPFLSDSGIDAASLSLRVVSVSIPEQSISEYDVNYKSRKITKFGGKITTPNEFSFTLRVDKNWNAYNAIKNWHNFMADNDSGLLSADYMLGVSIYRRDIVVRTIDTNDNATGGYWKFVACAPKSVPTVDLNYDSGDAIIVTVNMNFIKMSRI